MYSRALVVGLVLCVVVLGAAGCSKKKLQPGEARLSVSGRVLLTERGKAPKPVEKDTVIHYGDRVKLVTGTARIASADGTTYDLRCGPIGCAEATDFRLASDPTLEGGDLLVTAGRTPVLVHAAGSEVEVSGAARLARSLAVSAAVYRGSAVLRTGGRPFTVPALRQAAVPAIGVLPTAASPLAYDEGDEWDKRFLGAAMAFGRELEARGRAFGPNVRAGEGRTAGFYKLLLPELDREPAFDTSLLGPGSRSVGETLVGATIAVAGKTASFAERWRSVFGFRDEGAAWGLVALDQGVTDGPSLVSRLDAAIGRAPLRFSGPAVLASGPTTTTTTTPTTSTTVPRGGGGGSTTTTTTPTIPPTTPTTQPPIPPTTAAPLVQTVVDTLNGLLDPLF